MIPGSRLRITNIIDREYGDFLVEADEVEVPLMLTQYQVETARK